MKPWKTLMNFRPALAAALAVSALLASADSSVAGPLKSVKFQLNFSPYGGDAAFYLAKERGFYESEGLDVEILPGKTGIETATQVAYGRVDVATVLAMHAIQVASEGLEVVSVGNRFGRGGSGVVVDKRANVRTLKDLEGKTVLLASPTYSALLNAAMKKSGADPTKVKLVSISPAAFFGSFAAGQGDAIVTSAPAAEGAVKGLRDFNTLTFGEFGLSMPELSFIANPAKVKSDPEMIKGFLRATYRGMDLARQNPTLAAETMAKLVPGTSVKVALSQLEAFLPYQCAKSQAGKPVAYQSIDDWKNAIEIMKTESMIKSSPDLSKLVTNQFQNATELACP